MMLVFTLLPNQQDIPYNERNWIMADVNREWRFPSEGSFAIHWFFKDHDLSPDENYYTINACLRVTLR